MDAYMWALLVVAAVVALSLATNAWLGVLAQRRRDTIARMPDVFDIPLPALARPQACIITAPASKFPHLNPKPEK